MRLKTGLSLGVLLLVTCVRVAAAQESGHQDHDQQAHAQHEHDGHQAAVATHAEASGTAWEPAASALPGISASRGAWTVMAHWNLFAGFFFESGEPHRRSHQFTGINWAMGMAERPVSNGRLHLRGMLSAEPWTVPGCGYPDLLATGENCDGDNVHDRQHPHDLFMELAASYDMPIGDRLRWQVYGGAAGEPALGPAAFPHRASAFPNPIAPIAHHWLDSSHISYGVITTGVFTSHWKVEGSVFNGREPDEQRTDFDFAPMDSYSGRISFAPSSSLTVQISTGHLEEAEPGIGSLPRTDVNRATASLSYARMLSRGLLATTIAYGVNAQDTRTPTGLVPQTSHAILAEGSFVPSERMTWYGRVEVGGKPGHDLHATEYENRVLTVAKLEGGYTRFFATWRALRVGAGGTISTGILPPRLHPYYGGWFVPGFAAFVNVRPGAGHVHQ